MAEPNADRPDAAPAPPHRALQVTERITINPARRLEGRPAPLVIRFNPGEHIQRGESR